MNGGLWDALGDGWLGKALAALLAGTIAWFVRRPAEQAATVLAVDQRVRTLLDSQAEQMNAANERWEAASRRCDELIDARLADRAACDRELADMREDMRIEREKLRGEIDGLMRGPIARYGEFGGGDGA